MKVLFLAPQPFFQERGTPIAVRLAVQVLSARSDDELDLLTYHEGHEITIPNARIIRIPDWFRIRGVGPGISFKKLVCDFVFLITALRLVWRNRRSPYALVHAVEESVFVAAIIKFFWGIPYIYDMDSSLALQVTEKWAILKPLRPLLDFFERSAVRGSLAVVPVCDALAVIADSHGSKETMILRDVSLLESSLDNSQQINLRKEADANSEDVIILYIGNLEAYQGIDLLIESQALLIKNAPKALLVIIGGTEQHIKLYTQKSAALGAANRIRFLGPRPVASLSDYLTQADILVSPRTKGNNTPMKIYSYLHSGIAIVATDLPTHSQVLTPLTSVLTAPNPAAFASGLESLVNDATIRAKIGGAGKALAEELYTYPVFEKNLNALYDKLEPQVKAAAA